MFASKGDKASSKASEASSKSLPPRRSALSARSFGDAANTAPHRLQRSLGNQATLRLMGASARKPCGCSASPAAGGVQAKLAIGAVNDPLEHEADRAADHVMRMAAPTGPAPQLSETGSQISRKCAACHEDDDDDDKLKLRRKAATSSASPGEAPGAVHDALQSGGQPMDAGVRAFMEPRFGADFSDVRIHSDGAAGRSASEIDALAYTAGRDIVFGRGQYSPQTTSGRALLAHELAHVVQQRGGRGDAALRRAPRKSKTPERTYGQVYFVQVDRDANTISFVTEGGTLTYTLLTPTQVPVGSYRFKVEVQNARSFKLTAPAEATNFSPFQYSIAEGQPNPALLLKGMKEVNVQFIENGGARASAPDSANADASAGETEVKFQVQQLTPDAFTNLTGASPDSLTEGSLVSGASLGAAGGQDKNDGAGLKPGIGGAALLTRFPSYAIPPNATGVLWTQVGAGHFSQFSNVGGDFTARGFRYDLWNNLFPKLRETGLPGSYQNDFLFSLMPNQTLVYRRSDPGAAQAFAERLVSTRYNETYRFPARPGQVAVCGGNCITVPADEVTAALGVRPEIITPEGPADILTSGRPSPGAPFEPGQAGRGATVREWLGQDDSYFTERGLTRTKVPAFTPAARAGVSFIKVGGAILMIYGAYRTAKRINDATDAERPKVVMEEAGSWVGGALGSALGAAAAGAVFCLPAGPADFICVAGGFLGGLVFGAAGGYGGGKAGGAFSDFIQDAAGEAYRHQIELQGDQFPPGSEGAIDELLGPPVF